MFCGVLIKVYFHSVNTFFSFLIIYIVWERCVYVRLYVAFSLRVFRCVYTNYVNFARGVTTFSAILHALIIFSAGCFIAYIWRMFLLIYLFDFFPREKLSQYSLCNVLHTNGVIFFLLPSYSIRTWVEKFSAHTQYTTTLVYWELFFAHRSVYLYMHKTNWRWCCIIDLIYTSALVLCFERA